MSIDEKFENCIRIYTDGSKINEPEVSCGAAVVIKRLHTTEMLNFRLPPEMSILACELFAIDQALLYISTYDGNETKFVIYTDSKSSIELLKSQKNNSYLLLIYKICAQIKTLFEAQIEVYVQFVPGHKNIEGNELADLAAAAAHVLEVECIDVPKEDKVRNMKRAVLELWQGTWDRMVRVTSKGQHLKKKRLTLTLVY